MKQSHAMHVKKITVISDRIMYVHHRPTGSSFWLGHGNSEQYSYMHALSNTVMIFPQLLTAVWNLEFLICSLKAAVALNTSPFVNDFWIGDCKGWQTSLTLSITCTEGNTVCQRLWHQGFHWFPSHRRAFNVNTPVLGTIYRSRFLGGLGQWPSFFRVAGAQKSHVLAQKNHFGSLIHYSNYPTCFLSPLFQLVVLAWFTVGFLNCNGQPCMPHRAACFTQSGLWDGHLPNNKRVLTKQHVHMCGMIQNPAVGITCDLDYIIPSLRPAGGQFMTHAEALTIWLSWISVVRTERRISRKQWSRQRTRDHL